MTTHRVLRLIAFLLYQGLWVVVVRGAADGHPMVGPLAVIVLLAGSAVFDVRSAGWPRARSRLGAIGRVAALGMLVESMVSGLGILHYASPLGTTWLAPPWMVGLWALLGWSLTTSMAWARQRLWLSGVLGAIAGPMAFEAGRRLNAVRYGDTVELTLAMLAVVWGVGFPIAAWLAREPAVAGGSSASKAEDPGVSGAPASASGGA